MYVHICICVDVGGSACACVCVCVYDNVSMCVCAFIIRSEELVLLASLQNRCNAIGRFFHM